MSERRKRPEEIESDQELDALAQKEGAKPGDPLSEEIIRKWDPQQLLRLVSSRAGRGERLDESTRRRYEARLGVDLSDVRIYTGEFAEAVTKSHSAEAITVGGTGMIFMGKTANRSTATTAGRSLLAHELTHVAQDVRGVQPRGYAGATPLATEMHEAEAEAAEAEEAGEGADAPHPEKERQNLVEKLFARLIEVFEEEQRVWELRNGLPRYRS